MRKATALTDVVLRKLPSAHAPAVDELSRGTVFEVLDGPVSSSTGHPWFELRVASVPGGVLKSQIGQAGYAYAPNIRVEPADPAPMPDPMPSMPYEPQVKGSDPVKAMGWVMGGVTVLVLLLGWAVYYLTR